MADYALQPVWRERLRPAVGYGVNGTTAYLGAMSSARDNWIADLAARARSLCTRLEAGKDLPPNWSEMSVRHPSGAAPFCDAWAQAVICGNAALSSIRAHSEWQFSLPFPTATDPLVSAALDAAAKLPAVPLPDEPIDPTYFYEQFLNRYDVSARTAGGVFFTPQAVVQAVVQSLHDALRESFSIPLGLADAATWSDIAHRLDAEFPHDVDLTQPFVRILEPAVGTGAFLVEVIRCVHRTLQSRWEELCVPAADRHERWLQFVESDLLDRIEGVDVSLPALVLAHLNLAHALAETGYRGGAGPGIRLRLADSLLKPDPQDEVASLDIHPTVILGNPPFSGISENRGEWIRGLLRGNDPSGDSVANYYEVDGQPLGERKLWLQDDYVKFFRYAQWKIEAGGTGLVGFVTNHGYLDNATFRGMRSALLKTFPRISITDLHGNKKKHELPPDGDVDENLFDIEQGVAIGIFARPPVRTPLRVRYGEVWGDRSSKSLALNERLPQVDLTPQHPNFFLTPICETTDSAYARGFALNEIMPVHSTAVVTARDGFVIAESRDELEKRLERFGDLTVADEQIRAEMFTNGRSRRYPPGDTRGWKLAAARRRLATEPEWKGLLTRCLYRPFDWRSICWADWLVDWPRPEVTQHLREPGNLALIARRQMLPTQPCTFFWVSECITIDGVIRSDNRGTESVFPLFLLGTDRVNFTPQFLAAIESVLGRQWSASPGGKLDRVESDSREGGDAAAPLGPTDLFYYIYALFHSPSYRERYADRLRIEFPRVLLPSSASLFRQMSRIGKCLAAAHLNPVVAEPGELLATERDLPARFGAGYPRWRANAIEFDPHSRLGPIAAEVWNFRVGGYQVCRKWIRDRHRRGLSPKDYQQYAGIVLTLERTLAWMREVDAAIEEAGGWPDAFQRS